MEESLRAVVPHLYAEYSRPRRGVCDEPVCRVFLVVPAGVVDPEIRALPEEILRERQIDDRLPDKPFFPEVDV